MQGAASICRVFLFRGTGPVIFWPSVLGEDYRVGLPLSTPYEGAPAPPHCEEISSRSTWRNFGQRNRSTSEIPVDCCQWSVKQRTRRPGLHPLLPIVHELCEPLINIATSHWFSHLADAVLEIRSSNPLPNQIRKRMATAETDSSGATASHRLVSTVVYRNIIGGISCWSWQR